MSFHRYRCALNPITCESVSGNLRGAPSIRWMNFLNARERVSCILEFDVHKMTARMLEAMRQRQFNGKSQDIYLSIDATKCSQVINISTAFRSIMEVVYPNHMLNTLDMAKD